MTDSLDLTIGAVEALLAVALVVNLRRSSRTARLQAVLVAFFALRAGERIAAGISGRRDGSLDVFVDLVVGVTLVALLVTVGKTFGRIEETWDSARRRALEYERALADYRQLARHRLANPLTAIVGSARALHELPDLDPDTRRQLVRAILDEARRLEAASLEPGAPLAPEERGLQPEPHLDRQDR
jgi:signal transduction histidine kinase